MFLTKEGIIEFLSSDSVLGDVIEKFSEQDDVLFNPPTALEFEEELNLQIKEERNREELALRNNKCPAIFKFEIGQKVVSWSKNKYSLLGEIKELHSLNAVVKWENGCETLERLSGLLPK